MAFKIDSDIPLPNQEAAPEEPSKFRPYKAHGKRCDARGCIPFVGVCRACGDRFPCPSGTCGHLDCADPKLVGQTIPGNGTEIPEFVNVVKT